MWPRPFCLNRFYCLCKGIRCIKCAVSLLLANIELTLLLNFTILSDRLKAIVMSESFLANESYLVFKVERQWQFYHYSVEQFKILKYIIWQNNFDLYRSTLCAQFTSNRPFVLWDTRTYSYCMQLCPCTVKWGCFVEQLKWAQVHS